MTAAEMDLEIVSATRVSKAHFQFGTPLGRSLTRLRQNRHIKSRIAFDNSRGLSELYNAAIDATDGPDAMLFVHDDIWLHDLFVVERISDALESFDVVGIAGNTRRSPRQVSFYSVPEQLRQPDTGYLSGRFGIGLEFGRVADIGPVPAACEQLDGALLAVRRSTLRKSGVRFDPQFDFHFYDMDFCRTARKKGLRLGTWPIVISHRSWGNFDELWEKRRDAYLEKWPD